VKAPEGEKKIGEREDASWFYLRRLHTAMTAESFNFTQFFRRRSRRRRDGYAQKPSRMSNTG
jgi:hypothetical protein